MSDPCDTPANRSARGLLLPLALSAALLSLQLFLFMRALQGGIHGPADWSLVMGSVGCFLITAAIGWWALRRYR